MTPTEFTAWRERLGYNKAEAARVLEIGPNQPRHYESGSAPIPRHIALACAAIAHGLPPIGG